MRLTTTMFSCILIILEMVFQTTYAATDVFTINNRPPNSAGAFGGKVISQQERDIMIQMNSKGNSVFKTFPLLTNMNYFGNRGRPDTELNKIFVSYNIFSNFFLAICMIESLFKIGMVRKQTAV